jgi:hypothetical protein
MRVADSLPRQPGPRLLDRGADPAPSRLDAHQDVRLESSDHYERHKMSNKRRKRIGSEKIRHNLATRLERGRIKAEAKQLRAEARALRIANSAERGAE